MVPLKPKKLLHGTNRCQIDMIKSKLLIKLGELKPNQDSDLRQLHILQGERRIVFTAEKDNKAKMPIISKLKIWT